MTETRQAAAAPGAPGRPRYQYWLLPFAAGVAIALLVAIWLFPRGDVLAAPTPADNLEAQYLALQGDEKLLRSEVARLAAVIAGQRRDCRPPEPPPRRPQEARRPPVEDKPPVDDKPKPKPGDDLKIPDNNKPGDMSFLEGCWTTTSGLVNRRTREPIIYEYCFDKNGQGQTSVTERGGRRCVAPTSARMDDKGGLVIEDGALLQCPDGDHYVKTYVECQTGGGGSAQCNALQSDNTRWSATMKRKGGADVDARVQGDQAPGPGVGPGPGGRGNRLGPAGRLGPGPGTQSDDLPPADEQAPMDDQPPTDDQPPMDDQAAPQDDQPPPPPVRGQRLRPIR